VVLGPAFPVVQMIPLGGNLSEVEAFDFNQDGKDDLAVGSYALGSVFFYANDGTGHFGEGTPVSTGYGALSMITKDFNKDGKSDLAVVGFHDDWVTVLMSRP